MKRFTQILLASSVAAFALGLASCGGRCCSGEAPAPALRPLPNFDDVPEVHYGK